MKITSIRRYAIEVVDKDRGLALLLVYNRLVAYQEADWPIRVDNSQLTAPDIVAGVLRWAAYRKTYTITAPTGSVAEIARLMGVEVQ